MFAWLGLIITLLIWLGLAVLLRGWHDRSLTTISGHGASARGASLLFGTLLVAGGIGFYWWLIGWYVPHLHLPFTFSVVITIVVLYQILTGLNNSNRGLSKFLHSYTAQTMALLYLPLALLIIDRGTMPVVARAACVILAVYMLHSYVITEVMKKLPSRHLFFQTAYIVAFQLLILVSAYAA